MTAARGVVATVLARFLLPEDQVSCGTRLPRGFDGPPPPHAAAIRVCTQRGAG
jgi:hypothetical protein